MSPFLLFLLLIKACFSVTTLNTANLTPNRLQKNGASIAEVKTNRVQKLSSPSRWRLEHDTFGGLVSTNNGWYLHLSLDKASWSFDSSEVSILSIEIDAVAQGTSSDLLLIAFQQANNENYFATNIDLAGFFNNEMMPQWADPSSYLTGDVFDIVESNTATGSNYRSVAAGQNSIASYSPTTKGKYSSPFTMILTNDPTANELLYSYQTSGNGFTPWTCSFPAMNGDSRMNMYFAPDSFGDNIIDIYSIKVSLLSLDTITKNPTNDPTSEPTTEPTAEPTIEPSAEPSVVPTSLPSMIPSNVPTFMPTEKPSSIDTLNAFNPTIANEGENKIGQETTENGDLLEKEKESQNAATYGIIIGLVVALVLILIGVGVWWVLVGKKRKEGIQTGQKHHNMVSLSEVEVDTVLVGATKGQTLGVNTQSMDLGENEHESDGDAMYDEDEDEDNDENVEMNIASPGGPTPNGNDSEEDGIYDKGDKVMTPRGDETKKGPIDENEVIDDDDDDNLMYSKGQSPR